MKKEESEKYMKEQMRATQKKAAALNAALERKEHEETRERIKAKRKAATPLSDEEAARKVKNRKRKTIEEIIENGTPEERAAMVISDTDNNTVYGTPQRVIGNAKKRLMANFKKGPQQERSIFLFYLREYDRMGSYYNRLRTYIKTYHAETSLLASLVAKWESYDREADACTEQLKNFTKIAADGGPEAEEFIEICKEGILESRSKWEDATLMYDEVTRTFTADVDGEGKLYEKITAQAEDTNESLSKLKAFIEVGEGYILEEVALFVEPLQMELSVEMIENERYAREYGGPLKYFRSYLNERKNRGEAITQEEEKRAVFPDYFEIEANEYTTNFAKDFLQDL